MGCHGGRAQRAISGIRTLGQRSRASSGPSSWRTLNLKPAHSQPSPCSTRHPGSLFLFLWDGSFSEKLRHLSNDHIKRILIVAMKMREKDVKIEEHKWCIPERDIRPDFPYLPSKMPCFPNAGRGRHLVGLKDSLSPTSIAYSIN